MTRILYRATSPEGLLEANYVEAETEKEAVAKLKAEGYSDVVLYDLAPLARLAKEREKLDPATARKMAASEVAMHENPCWKTLLRTAWATLRGSLLGAAAVIVGAWWFEIQWLFIIGIGFGITVVLLGCWLLWQYYKVMEMMRCAEAFALGDWDAVQRIGERLRKSGILKRAPTGLIDIEIKLAYAEIAKAGSAASERLPDVLRRLEVWRDKSPAPGLYENFLGMVYHKAGDYPAYLACMRRAGEIEQSCPVFIVDWAMAEARFGDTTVATDLLAEIDPETLCWAVRMLYPYVAGMVALREEQNEDALFHLQAAVSGFLVCGKNPHTWSFFSLCSGACALALVRTGQHEAAKNLVLRVKPMLYAHGDQPLLAMIEREVML